MGFIHQMTSQSVPGTGLDDEDIEENQDELSFSSSKEVSQFFNKIGKALISPEEPEYGDLDKNQLGILKQIVN